jgi:hypothetical protein
VNWAELLLLQGDFAPHHYLSQHDKPLRRPKPLVDMCCAGGCALASQAPQRGAPQHKCWRAPAVPASISPELSASDGEDTIFGSFQALDPTPPPSPLQMRPPDDWRNHLEEELEKEELKRAAAELEPEPEPEPTPNSLLGLVASYDSEEYAKLSFGH